MVSQIKIFVSAQGNSCLFMYRKWVGIWNWFLPWKCQTRQCQRTSEYWRHVHEPLVAEASIRSIQLLGSPGRPPRRATMSLIANCWTYPEHIRRGGASRGATGAICLSCSWLGRLSGALRGQSLPVVCYVAHPVVRVEDAAGAGAQGSDAHPCFWTL